jgi:hypothetical protein
MKAGMWALALLTGLVYLLWFLNWELGDSYVSIIPILGALPILIFLIFCLVGVSCGHRIAAILVLFVPVFLSLPFVTECLLLFLDGSDTLYAILFRLLMLAMLIAAWPLAFGEMARVWYRHCKRVKKINRQRRATSKSAP